VTFSPTFLEKQPYKLGEIWRTGFLHVLDRFSKNRLASQISSSLEGKISSLKNHHTPPYTSHTP
jgi:hypothetical protein